MKNFIVQCKFYMTKNHKVCLILQVFLFKTIFSVILWIITAQETCTFWFRHYKVFPLWNIRLYSATSFKIALHRVCFCESKKFWLLLIFPQESLWWEVVRNLRIYRCAFSIRFRFGHFYIADQWKFCIEFISNRKYWELLSTATLWSYQTFNYEMQLGVKSMRLTNHFAIALFMVL